MRLAVLSNINFSPIAKIYNNVYVSGIAEYYQELLSEGSYLNQNVFDMVFCFLDVEENIDNFSSILDPMLELIRNYLTKNSKTLFVMSSFFKPLYCVDHYLKNSPTRILLQEYNKKLAELSEFPNFYLFDFGSFLAKYGYKNLISPNYWYLGRIKFNLDTYKYLIEELKNIYNAFKGNAKKVLILDLDNTLWGGIVGEDGIDGIKLSEDGVGKIYRDFQKNIKKLKELGVLLVIVSKNNYDDVLEVFTKHPMMVLKWDDFIIKKINWKPKPENIKEVAIELNLGLDSFVFIDDSIFERNLVREILPECSVPEFPDDISLLNLWFFEEVVYKYFPKLRVTEEDRAKTDQYIRNFQRESLKSNLTLDEYIKQLDIKLTYYVNDKRFISRMAQLTQRTNQFNLTTRRYTESDISAFLNRDDVFLVALEYEDRFGKEGIVGLAIVFVEGDSAVIDTFLMSCRIIGRKVEYNFMNYLIDYLKKMGIRKFYGEYIPTAKNIIVRNFYKECGFTEYEEYKYYKGV